MTFPLLMPTTLFVLVNAVINAFRLVDHVVVMTRGGPDNATELLLYYIYEIGFRFWDSAYAATLTMVLLAILGLAALAPVRVPRAQGALPVKHSAQAADALPAPGIRLGASGTVTLALETLRRGCSACCGCCRSPTRSGRRSTPSEFSTHFVLDAPLTLDNFVEAWQAAPFARYFLNTVMLVTMVLAAQLVLVTLAAYAFARFEVPGTRRRSSRWCWCSSW